MARARQRYGLLDHLVRAGLRYRAADGRRLAWLVLDLLGERPAGGMCSAGASSPASSA